MELSEAAIAALKSQHGNNLFSVKAPDGSTLVFRGPTRAVWTEFVDTITRDKASKATSILKCVLQCCVHPSRDEVSALFDQFPAFPTSVNNKLAEMAGQVEELDVKKL